MQATETISEKELQRAQNRLERRMELVWTHAEAIVEVEPGVWSVPASRGGEYRVRLGEFPGQLLQGSWAVLVHHQES
jgi:hypothetical protein